MKDSIVMGARSNSRENGHLRLARRGWFVYRSLDCGLLDSMGVRFSRELATQLFRRVRSMKESVTYQAIVEEGREEGREEGAVLEARKLLRMFGDGRFGAPDMRTAAAIRRIKDLIQLEELCRRISTVESWKELLVQPDRPPRGKRRRPST